MLMLNESATQKPTKFQAPHWRRSCSTGFKSWFVNWECGGQLPIADTRDIRREISHHQLGGRQARLGFDGQLVRQPPEGAGPIRNGCEGGRHLFFSFFPFFTAAWRLATQTPVSLPRGLGPLNTAVPANLTRRTRERGLRGGAVVCGGNVWMRMSGRRPPPVGTATVCR